MKKTLLGILGIFILLFAIGSITTDWWDKTADDDSKTTGETFRILEDNFMSVQQAIGVRKALGGSDETVKWLNRVIDECLGSNLIEELIQKHGIQGKLYPAKF